MGKGEGTCVQRGAMVLDVPTGLPDPPVSEQELEQRLAQASSYPERVLLAHQLRQLRCPDEQLPEPRLEPQRLDHAFEASLKGEMAGHPRAVFLEGSILQDGICYVEYGRPRVLRQHLYQELHHPPYVSYEHGELVKIRHSVIPKLLEHHTKQQDMDAVDRYYLIQQYRIQLRDLLTPGSIFVRLAGDKLTYEDWLQHLKEHAPLVWEFGFDDEQRTSGPARRVYELLVKSGDPVQRRVWTEGEEERFAAFAKIPDGDDERRLLEQLRQTGAKLEESPIEVPEYESSHHIEGGYRYRLDLGNGAVLYYTPHRSIGTTELDVSEMKAEITLTPERLQQLRKQLDEGYAQYAFHPHEHVLVSELVDKDGNPVLDEEGKPKPARLLAKHKLSAQEQETLFAAAEAGEVAEYRGARVRLRPATAQDLEELGGERYIKLDDGRYHTKFMYDRWQGKRQGLEELAQASPEALKLTWHSKDLEAGPEEELEDRLRELKHESLTPNARRYLVDLWRRKELRPGQELVTSKQITTVETDVPQTAPASERGVLKLEGARPAEVVEHLRRLGLCRRACREVPYNLIYGESDWKGNRHGLIAPTLDEYATGKERINLPADCMVLHGLTGVANVADASERLANIVRSGGLKSIAERRRAALSVDSMSPRGDIASGIDMGVPCKIGPEPSYGTYIFFGMRPQIMERRNIIFADQDFGGGHDRYPQFANYAKTIGHSKPYDPPSHQARCNHLKTGLGDYNEAYFFGEIRWDDIDTIFVTEQNNLADWVSRRMEEWKKQGLVPEHVKVRPYCSYPPKDEIVKRARELAAEDTQDQLS